MSQTPFITGQGRGRARGRRDIAEGEQLAERRPGRFRVDDWEGQLAETQSDMESKWKSMEDSAPGPLLNPSVCLSVWPAVTRWHCVKMTHDTVVQSALGDRAMPLVLSG